jgi:acetyl esterase/lipase
MRERDFRRQQFQAMPVQFQLLRRGRQIAKLVSESVEVGWPERRKRLDEVGSIWPVADDVKLTALDVSGVAGEWSIVPGSDRSRVLMFFHGGGYCSGSIVSHRQLVTKVGRATGVRTLALGYRLAPEHPFPAAYDAALTAWRFLRGQNIPAANIAIGGESAGAGPNSSVDQSPA